MEQQVHEAWRVAWREGGTSGGSACVDSGCAWCLRGGKTGRDGIGGAQRNLMVEGCICTESNS